MTNEEIQKHIEQNCRNEHDEPMMDEQTFYEGAKWMRDRAEQLQVGAIMPSFDDVVRINQRRFVSQTTHFVCAKCGGDTPLTNRELLPLKTELVADKLVKIYFPCPKCDETYDIGLSVLS